MKRRRLCVLLAFVMNSAALDNLPPSLLTIPPENLPDPNVLDIGHVGDEWPALILATRAHAQVRLWLEVVTMLNHSQYEKGPMYIPDYMKPRTVNNVAVRGPTWVYPLGECRYCWVSCCETIYIVRENTGQVVNVAPAFANIGDSKFSPGLFDMKEIKKSALRGDPSHDTTSVLCETCFHDNYQVTRYPPLVIRVPIWYGNTNIYGAYRDPLSEAPDATNLYYPPQMDYAHLIGVERRDLRKHKNACSSLPQ